MTSRIMRTAAVVALAGLSASCGTSAAAPSECPTDEILPTINQYVDGSVFIDTPWQPDPGTDLAAAIDAGGVACSYGVQEAEVGTTILWAPGDDVFAERSTQWQADGQQRVEVGGADEAWALIEDNGTERHLWSLNLLVDGVWIHIGATFLQDLDEARALVDAAIAVVRA